MTTESESNPLTRMRRVVAVITLALALGACSSTGTTGVEEDPVGGGNDSQTDASTDTSDSAEDPDTVDDSMEEGDDG